MLGQVIRDIVGAAWKRKAGSNGPDSPTDPNPLEQYFYNNPSRAACKWGHYFEIYHRHLQRYRGKSPVIVEIGVAAGGSLPMWHYYFGRGARVVGIDVDPACRQFADDRTSILIGDQGDRSFLATVRQSVPHIDILIDDGGHHMHQQIATFEELYPHIDANGVYVCEDTHTSLWPGWGGGIRKSGTFLEYTKTLVDRLHAWHSKDPAALAVDAFTRSTHGLHIYDSVVVLEKRPMEPPRQFLTKGILAVGSNDAPVQFRP